MVYSLLSVMSTIWKAPNDPILVKPYRSRNVPFHNIEIIIAPGNVPVLTYAKTAAYIHTFLLREITVNADWPANGMNCDLVIEPSGVRIGKMYLNLRPMTAWSPESYYLESGIPLNISTDTTAAIELNSTSQTSLSMKTDLGAIIDVDLRYTGTRATNRVILELFTRLLGYLWQRNPRAIATRFPPEV